MPFWIYSPISFVNKGRMEFIRRFLMYLQLKAASCSSRLEPNKAEGDGWPRPLGRIPEERAATRPEEGRIVALERKRVARVVPWYTTLGEDQVGEGGHWPSPLPIVRHLPNTLQFLLLSAFKGTLSRDFCFKFLSLNHLPPSSCQ